MPQQRLGAIIITVGIIFVALTTFTFLSSQLASVGGPYETDETVLLQGTGNFVDIQDDVVGESETVRDSTGYGLQLTGTSDSYAKTTFDIEFATDNTWTVAAVGNADTASKNMTLISVNGRLTISYNSSDDVWRAWYYDEGSTNSYTVNVSAPSPTNTTTLIAYSNGTHLTLERDGVESNTTTITSSNIEPAPVNSTNWDGWIDEFRTADKVWNSTQRSNWHSYPVTPVLNAGHTSRIMFDEPNRNTQRIFYAESELKTYNATFVSGVAGTVLDAQRNIIGQADYEWQVQGPRIKPLAGGMLDQAPVAYVNYKASSKIEMPLDGIGDAFSMGGIVMVLIIAGAAIGYLREVR